MTVDDLPPFSARVADPDPLPGQVRLVLGCDTGHLPPAGAEVLVIPGGRRIPLQENPDPPPPSPGVLVVPDDLWARLTPAAQRALAEGLPSGSPITNAGDLPPVPWGAIAWTIGRVLLVLALMAGALWAGYTLGLRDHGEERRTRRAVCQVLDQLGADASTAAQAEPCRDTPATIGGHP